MLSPGDAGEPAMHWTLALSAPHRDNVLDFVYPEGFGYYKDRQNVVGFRPHQFRRVPTRMDAWKLESLELVGLVVHEYAVVYVSDSLPRMDTLRTVPVRPLDAFESLALRELQEGESLVAREQQERLRVLGAVRAARQCVECHACERGELLGAFSYVLRKQE